MMFELFSVHSDTSPYPGKDDLWVRFLYRSSTDPGTGISEYPLFGRGYSESRMKYNDFVAEMKAFAIQDVLSWCSICGSTDLFCTALQQTTGNVTDSPNKNSTRSYTLSPVVAGVIGAITTLAVIAMAATSAAVFGGLRIHRADAGQKGSLGGFKGAEKMASDEDLSVAKGGAKHERVGSWELGGPGGLVVGASKHASTFEATTMRDVDDDDDSNIMGKTPVKPLERV